MNKIHILHKIIKHNKIVLGHGVFMHICLELIEGYQIVVSS